MSTIPIEDEEEADVTKVVQRLDITRSMLSLLGGGRLACQPVPAVAVDKVRWWSNSAVSCSFWMLTVIFSVGLANAAEA